MRQGGFFDEAIGFQSRIGRNGRGNTGYKINALNSQSGETGKGDAAPCVAFRTAGNCGPFNQGDKTGALNTATDPNQNIVQQGYAVRRLTPTECERLQGFPDGFTAIEINGKPAADGPRYRVLGNSMAVPVLKWIGQRIDMVNKI